MRDGQPSVEDVEDAVGRVREVAIRTPVVASPALSRRVGVDVGLKLESLQPTGSFKVRGAAARILSLDAATAARGVVTASTGNHGRAVAYVARERGIPATVCVSDNVPAGKLAALRRLGCDLVVGGRSQTEALVAAGERVASQGMTLVHPFDDPAVIAGQGTVGLELVEQWEHAAVVVVPLSGGGLLAGVALAVKARRPDVRVVGVSMEDGAVMATSLAAGSPVELDELPTLADSLQGGIGADNRHTFAIVRELVDDVVLVGEEAIWAAMRSVYDEHRVVLEGAAAVGVAALTTGLVVADGPVVVVCSGGNAEPEQVAAMARGDAAPPT
ncbi:MAG: pyridoxal-phosphate dependent enzyme [Actinobacteria bacterium]|nr:pyridoxal-phosphate dependent enzyme [Actinomycetota bacterium]